MQTWFFCYFESMPFKFNLTAEERDFLRRCGRKGGMKRNCNKGFGTPGNARKAALARWSKAKRKG